MRKFAKRFIWTFILIILFVFAVGLFQSQVINKQKTEKELERIKNTKLTLDDVLGTNLPPKPDEEKNNSTIAGIDANKNSIRDDVELAIFEKYPNSAKKRAPLLQYAQALQVEMTLEVLNEETATAIMENIDSKAYVCLWNLSDRNSEKFVSDIDFYENFIRKIQINTKKREGYMENFYEEVRSFSSSNDSCDIDLNTLPN